MQCCSRSDEYFGGTKSASQPSHIILSSTPMDRLAHKCVSLQFLLEINEKVVQPYRPTMTVKEVVEEIIIPATREKGCSFIDHLRPNMYVTPHAFISHAFGNPFTIIVESLKAYFKDAVFSEVYVWIDIFIINQHRPGDDLYDGLTLKATIEASGSVVVCLDKNTLPLFRLWCLYEIGSTPIEKLVLLTHGFDASELGRAYAKIDATTADCFSQADKERIRGHIRAMMVEQRVVDSTATIAEALTAFTRVLKLLLLLKPTSYAADMAALLARAGDYPNYPLQETVGQACMEGKLICIVGGSGEGKSTLAAALVKTIRIDAYHFCKKADVRRQDFGLVIRSLCYQLAIRYPAFAQSILDLAPLQVESLSDEVKAWELLLEIPLRAVRGLRLIILIDALDESGEGSRMIALIVQLNKVLEEESSITFIVTTRPEPALLSPLRSHWKGERYQEFTPSELRGEAQTGLGGAAVSPLLRTLTGLILMRDPTSAAPADLSTAYDMIFDRGAMEQHRAVLEVVLASYQPQSLSDLKGMGLLEMARTLPGHGELFLERENKLHLLHRSIEEWLLAPEHGAVHARSGHERLAAHIWDTVLRPWLLPSLSPSSSSPPSSTGSVDNSRRPLTGSYSLKYALDHLREAGRFHDIQATLFRLPWLQAILSEKGLAGLMKDLLSLRDHPTLAAPSKKLTAVLRLSSSALFGSDAWKCLPAQILGRLRETEKDPILQSLRRESNSPSLEKWLKPLRSTLNPPGNLEITMIGHKGEVYKVIALPDGRVVSCSSDRTLRIWNANTGDCEAVLRGHEGEVYIVIALPDGRVLSCSKDNTFRVWNTTTGDCETVLGGHDDFVKSVIALPDGRVVSCSLDKTLRIWNANTGVCEAVLKGHDGPVLSVITLPDGRLVSCSSDKTLRVWNATTGDCEAVLIGHDGIVDTAIALPGGRVLSCSRDKTLRVWNAATGVCEKVLRGHDSGVLSVIALPNGRVVSCSMDKTLRVWNATTGVCETVLRGHDDWVTSVIALPDGRVVSCSIEICTYTLRVWNPTTGVCEAFLRGHDHAVQSFIALPDGRVVSCSTDETLRVWNANRGYHKTVRKGHDGPVRSIFALPDGRLLSQGRYGGCLLWSPVVVKEEGFFKSLFRLWSSPQEGFRCESLSEEELFEASGVGWGSVELDDTAAGYSKSSNSAVSESYGRVFVDGPVDWVVKIGDIIAVFQSNGMDHWFREVSC